MRLREAWDSEAASWIAWVRRPGHDSYDEFHRDQFFDLLPPRGKLTIDVGCGEGRVARDLTARGHQVRAFDGSPALVAAARDFVPSIAAEVADATALPLPDACADLVVAFMVLHDLEDIDAAARETARVLEPGGRLCFAIVHPLNSAGRFKTKQPDSWFRIGGSYLARFDYSHPAEHDGLKMVFHSRHRPLADYFAALAGAGFVVETLREPSVPEEAVARSPSLRRWQRVPLFLHVLARRA